MDAIAPFVDAFIFIVVCNLRAKVNEQRGDENDEAV